MKIPIEVFQKQLDAISIYNDVPYGRVALLFDEEEKHNQECIKYNGYLALSDAFKCLFLEAVELINTECTPKITAPLHASYSLFVTKLVHSFKLVCGAERLAMKGYPYPAYTLLRNTFDNLILVSAALQQFTDFNSIEGVEEGKYPDLNKVKKLRKATEFEVRCLMTGAKSGLSQATVDELTQWDALFDFEVHGARLSLASYQEWIKGKAPLPVLPAFNEDAFAMFMNRYCEVAWMICRLLPLMQPSEVPLNDSWKGKWKILDQSFENIVESLTSQLDKQIGAAISEFVNVKYPFNENTAFTL